MPSLAPEEYCEAYSSSTLSFRIDGQLEVNKYVATDPIFLPVPTSKMMTELLPPPDAAARYLPSALNFTDMTQPL